MKIPETELFAPIERLLKDQGYDIYPEVQPYQGGSRIDIYGKKFAKSVIVEMKSHMGLRVLEQAYEWSTTRAANKVYIAIPVVLKEGVLSITAIEYYNISPVVRYLCRQSGMGLILVNVDKGIAQIRIEAESREVDEDLRNKIEKTLSPFHKEQQGGISNAIGAFEITCRYAVQYLEGFTNDWVELRQMMQEINHHYAGEKPHQTLRRQFERYRSDIFEFSTINRRLHIKLKEGYRNAAIGEKAQAGLTKVMGAVNNARR